ncbi:MAG: hypothetical protein IPK26_09065 [Planctomycetes bacterium]|nr:hypothetical protein [Planctomycetota bacterium]
MIGRAFAVALLGAALTAQQPAGAAPAPDLTTKAAAQVGLDQAIGWLVANQNADGSWASSSCDSQFETVFAVETHYAWKMAACALATQTLLRAKETPAIRAALDKAVRWLCSTRMTLRGTDWDNDAVWAWLYGTVAMTAVANDPRFQNDQWRGPVVARGREFVRWLEANQEPTGGFGYYDDPTYTRRPKWGTSFATSTVLPALGMAGALGWMQDPRMRERAASYIKKCKLPNGAYSYDLTPIPRISGGEHINNVKGSLGRIQVCNWALRQFGDPDITDEVIRQGLRQFFEHHEFLHVARMRPIPHEAYYANAGYFYFFGHYYCAEAIQLLPTAEREGFHAQLRPHLLKPQRADGSCSDFLGSSYMVVASTAFLALALQAGL